MTLKCTRQIGRAAAGLNLALHLPSKRMEYESKLQPTPLRLASLYLLLPTCTSQLKLAFRDLYGSIFWQKCLTD